MGAIVFAGLSGSHLSQVNVFLRGYFVLLAVQLGIVVVYFGQKRLKKWRNFKSQKTDSFVVDRPRH
ncbi:hypothetical protein CKA32_001790 [Geitlerinema sp. FC II]|nr:hypothetical protein CKA32_001790 [Geitlerinema sp. FC II]